MKMRLSWLLPLLLLCLLANLASAQDYTNREFEEYEEMRSASSSSESFSSEDCDDRDCKKTVVEFELPRHPQRPRPPVPQPRPPPTSTRRTPPVPAPPGGCAPGAPRCLSAEEKARRRAAYVQFLGEVRDAKGDAPGLEGKWTSRVTENLVLLDGQQLEGLNGDLAGPEEAGLDSLGGGQFQIRPVAQQPGQRSQPERELQSSGRFDLDDMVDEAPQGSRRAKRQGEQSTGVTCQEFVFDSRKKWPQCAEIIGNVRDQSLCGDCWAVSASSTFTDRLCIQRAMRGMPVTSGEDNLFSAYDTAVCSDGAETQDGCKGGSTAKAWRWYTNSGVVTGGGNNDSTGCLPYPFPPTDDADKANYQALLTECTARCRNSNLDARYNTDKAKAASWNFLYGNKGWEEAMKAELFNNGSISASLMVFEDFKTYSGGVYSHVTGRQLGGHAIRLIGYGNITCSDGSSQKYWLGVNSWNTDWGLGGLFKIARGGDMCGIESRQISFGIPNV